MEVRKPIEPLQINPSYVPHKGNPHSSAFERNPVKVLEASKYLN